MEGQIRLLGDEDEEEDSTTHTEQYQNYPPKSASSSASAKPFYYLLLAVLALILMFSINNPGAPQSTMHPDGSAHLRFQNWNLRNDAQPNGDSIQKSINDLPRGIPDDRSIHNWYSQTQEVPWSRRRLGVANEVRYARPAIFTVNEALVRQIRDLNELLAPMRSIGVGRDDGKEAGEFQSIYYDPSILELLDWDTFWLSATPSVPSKFPGAGSYRSATVGHFSDRSTGVEFVVINLHLDEQSEEQRKLGAALTRLRGSFEFAQGRPCFVVGDFNSFANGTDSAAYHVLTGTAPFNLSDLNPEFRQAYANEYENTFVFEDMLGQCPPERRAGNLETFTNFLPAGKDYKRIDFQFGGNPNVDGIDRLYDVELYRVGENWSDNGFYLSDHRPVVADIIMRN